MIVLAIIDVCEINPERVGDVSKNQLFLRAKEAANPDEARLKLGAYILLSHLAREYMGADVLPEICYTPMGKPYFATDFKWQFNIAHDRDLCAVVLSDSCDAVGVDLQSMPERKIRLERIRQRFFAPLDYLSGKSGEEGGKIHTLSIIPEFFSAKQTTDGYAAKKLSDTADFEKVSERGTADLDFLTKWTLLEATVKATGEGISTYRNSEKVDTDSYISAFKYNGRTFSVSCAVISNKN